MSPKIKLIARDISALFERTDNTFPVDQMEFEINKILLKHGIEEPDEMDYFNGGMY